METIRLIDELKTFLIMEGQSGKIDFYVACEMGELIDKIKDSVINDINPTPII